MLATAGLVGLFGLLSVAAPAPAVFATLSDLPAAARRAGPDIMGLAVAGAGCWVALAWLALAIAVLAVEARDGRCGRIAHGVAAVTVPTTLRRLLATGIGLAVVASTAAGPALAAGPTSQRPVGAAARMAGFDLDWPVPRARPANRPVARAPVVVVRPGDTLWAIAHRHLAGDATDSAVAATWPRWYAANRSLIGPDPDLLLPGQRLIPPPRSPGDSS